VVPSETRSPTRAEDRGLRETPAPLWLALVIALCSAALTLYILRVPADASHRFPDGATIRFQATTLASGRLVAEAPPQADAFKLPMVRAEEGKWFGPYYPGFATILAAGVATGLDWVVNPLLGGLAVFGTFLLGYRVYSAWTGVLAALLLALSPMHTTLSASYLSHVSCGALLLYSAVVLLWTRPNRELPYGLASGFLFGWAVCVRPYTSLWLALPFLGVLMLAIRRSPRAGLRSLVAFGVGAVPWAIVILGWNQLITGSVLQTPYSRYWPELRLGFVDIPERRGLIPGVPIYHYSPAVAWEATKRQLAGLGGALLPVPHLASLVFLLPLVFCRRIGRRGALLALAPFALIAGYFFYPETVGIATILLGPRYYSEALPALALLVAQPLVGGIGARSGGRWIVGAAALALVATAATQSVPKLVEETRRIHENPLAGPNRICERYLRGLGAGRRLVFVDISTYERASALLVNSPDLSGENVVAIYRDPAQNRAVLDAFPGREAYLFRWDRIQGAVEFVPYVPEEDEKGPSYVFPENRRGGVRR
jgi:hypothetical protein